MGATMRATVIGAVFIFFFAVEAWAQDTNNTSGAYIDGLSPCTDSNPNSGVLRKLNYPPLGTEVEAEVGQSIISYYNLVFVETEGALLVDFTKPSSFRGSHAFQDFEATIPMGLRLEFNSAHNTYKIGDYKFQYANESTPRGGFSRPDLTLSLDPSGKSIVASLNFGFSTKQFPVDVSTTVKPPGNCLRSGDNSFKRELIYTGVSQGTIILLYREFKNDIARPAFSQELRFDLKEGDEIGYKGARFKVKKANNLGLAYSVERHLQ